MLKLPCRLIFAVLPILAIAASDAPIMTKSGPVATPAPGQGLVIFFRPGIMGAIMGCTVHEGPAEIARLGAKKYLAVPEQPGVHEYSTRGELQDRLKLEVEEDETYYVKCEVSGGNWGGRANLEPSNREEFAEHAPHLNQAKAR